MPFITQGKTNLQYIFIIVVLGILAGGGILGYYYLWIKELDTRLAQIELKLPESKPLNDRYCEQESDCYPVSHLGVCLNKNFLEMLPPEASIPAVLFDCDCINNKCARIEKEEGAEKDKDCQFVSEEEFPSMVSPSDMDKIVIDPKSNSKIISNEVIISFVEETSVDVINSIVCDINGVIIGAIPELGFFQIEIPDTGDSEGVYLVIEKLKEYPAIEVVEPNGVME